MECKMKSKIEDTINKLPINLTVEQNVNNVDIERLVDRIICQTNREVYYKIQDRIEESENKIIKDIKDLLLTTNVILFGVIAGCFMAYEHNQKMANEKSLLNHSDNQAAIDANEYLKSNIERSNSSKNDISKYRLETEGKS